MPTGGIGNSATQGVRLWWQANDRLLYRWQFHAGRLAEQTIDQHLAAIRFMEDVLEGKRFDHLTIRDVDRVRASLKEALTGSGEHCKSRSTASHQASQIKAFLEWLIKQEGYKRLPGDLPGYIQLPKAAYASAMPKQDKAYPTIEEAASLLAGMPAHSLMISKLGLFSVFTWLNPKPNFIVWKCLKLSAIFAAATFGLRQGKLTC